MSDYENELFWKASNYDNELSWKWLIVRTNYFKNEWFWELTTLKMRDRMNKCETVAVNCLSISDSIVKTDDCEFLKMNEYESQWFWELPIVKMGDFERELL